MRGVFQTVPLGVRLRNIMYTVLILIRINLFIREETLGRIFIMICTSIYIYIYVGARSSVVG
jgi:hypothetical protein